MPTNGRGSPPPRITIYTSPACHWCRTAKRYLEGRGLAYLEINVADDPRGRQEMVRMTGQSGVPVIRVGERSMTGWDKVEFERLLHGAARRR